MFVVLLRFSISLSRIVNAPGHTKYTSLNNQCKTRRTLINLHPYEYSQGPGPPPPPHYWLPTHF